MEDRNTIREQVEVFILELLAADLQRDAAGLRAELTAEGLDMPFDSILLVELMTRVEARYGVRLNATLPTARDMRSVRSFAERICDELEASTPQPSPLTEAHDDE